MNWTKRLSPGLQAQGLDDLEDILNSPAPALDSTTPDSHQFSSAVPSTTVSDLGSGVLAGCADSDDAAALLPQGRAVATCSSPGPGQPAYLPSRASTDATEPNKMSVWSTAYRSASTPLSAVWARMPEQLHNLPSLTAFDNRSEGHSASRSQYLLDLMAKNRAATAVATVAGAAAGGAVAGPFGIAAGAKTGALMVAVGAAAAGAAQQYYLPVVSSKPVAASADPQSHTDSQASRPEQLP